MKMVDLILANDEEIAKFTKINFLQNYPLYDISITFCSGSSIHSNNTFRIKHFSSGSIALQYNNIASCINQL